MSLFLVTFDLGKAGTDYPELVKKINRYSNIRMTESSFAIITDKPPADICAELQKHTGDDNPVFVITLKRPYEASTQNLVSDWLYKELIY
jgi:hypothetical protein